MLHNGSEMRRRRSITSELPAIRLSALRSGFVQSRYRLKSNIIGSTFMPSSECDSDASLRPWAFSTPTWS